MTAAHTPHVVDASDQHGAGNTLFARDREVMAWLFDH